MSNGWVRFLVGAMVMVAAAAVTGGPAAATEPVELDATWTATELALPPGGFSARVNGTDRVDQIVGSVDTIEEGQQHRVGAIWRGGELTVLGEASGELTSLTAINTSGVAVGSHFGLDFRPQATRHVAGHFEDLPAPAGAESVATSVNERGDIVGTANGQVILWPAADPTAFRLLPMPFPTSATAGVSIDDDGTVVAAMLEPVGSGPSRAFRWDRAGQPRELERVRHDSEHSVLTISNGRIAGMVSVFGGVIWNAKGQVRRFLPDTQLYALNESGHLLARSSTGGPWFVQENGCRVALPDNFSPSGPTTLTNDGAVAGYATDEFGVQTAVLWRRA